ncbi:alpha/beta hydrolase, partial [Aspergillus vadensis CBS 113365]
MIGMTASAREFEGVGVWDRNDNERAWRVLLGEERSGSHEKGVVSEYSAPGRAEWLGGEGMPKGVYLDVGSTDTLRDEGVEFARRLLRDGVQCEVHVWPGAFHGFDLLCPGAEISGVAGVVRGEWLRRWWF